MNKTNKIISYKILTDPNPLLRFSSSKVSDFGPKLQKTIDRMIVTMQRKDGVGLAAPQVGISEQIIVLGFFGDCDEDRENSFPLTVLINPQIVECSKEQIKMVEGCLSFPDLKASVKRPKSVVVKGVDRFGKPITIQAEKLFARVLQHEIDHLNGILLSDRLEKIKTVLFSNMELGLPVLRALALNPQFSQMTLVCTKNTDIKHSMINIRGEANKLGVKSIIWQSEHQVISKLKKIKPKLFIVAGFGKILSSKLLMVPKHGSLNIHPSLLPKYRGPSPIQNTILNGDSLSGVSIISMNEAVDAGPMIGQLSVKLSGREYYRDLLLALGTLGADLLIDLLPHYLADELRPTPQDESLAVFCKTFVKDDGEILKSDNIEAIDRKVRAFHHWPTVYTFSGNNRLQLLETAVDDENKIKISKVRPASGKAMPLADFKRGHRLPLDNIPKEML